MKAKILTLLALLGVCGWDGATWAQPFDGGKGEWHGFDRYDYIIDSTSLSVEPFQAPPQEHAGVGEPPPGKRRCVVVVPKEPAAGLPWSWRGCYWDHQPQAEIELLRRGFHVAYISASATLRPDKEWDAWYEFLTTRHGLSKRPAFVGMSRGGEFAYTWATSHPDEVSCIYADNPGGNPEMLARLGDLARYDVPLLHVCGSIDPLLGRYSSSIESIYQQFGGRISVLIKEGYGHHPHSLRDPKVIADFIEKSAEAGTNESVPAFAPPKFRRTSFYGVENSYTYSPSEKTYLTCRGPAFNDCYDRFDFELPGVEGTVTVIAPKTAADGTPWVFRAGFVPRDAKVDLGLLAHGFHIIVGPVPYNGDGPTLESWNKVYRHLVDHGFSAKPVLEGEGGAAGPAYAWAIQNPTHVSCLYGANPILRDAMSETSLSGHLKPLADAGIPLLHVAGTHDPSYDSDIRQVETKYQALGGKMTVIAEEGAGHYPLEPVDPGPVIDFIVKNNP